MQPAPVRASQPGGQAAAELAADVGHRRPGERAGLHEAEVVDLQPADLTGLPAADDRSSRLGGRPGAAGAVACDSGYLLSFSDPSERFKACDSLSVLRRMDS
jgi:hypothetical protein